MPYCRNCGSEIPADASFCPSCGASAVVSTGGYSSPTPPRYENEFDRLTRDSKTQDIWVRRVVAYIIDAIAVGIVATILALIAFIAIGLGSGFFFGSFFATAFNPFSPFTGLDGLLFVLYFTFADAMYRRTLGKAIMGLEVVTVDGTPLDLGKSFIRNISKIYWLLLLLDLLGGFFMHVQPGQKFSDHVAHTVVIARRS